MTIRMLACALALLPCPALAATVIDGVTIVDPASGRATPNRAIVIDGGKVVRIARAGSVRQGTIVDARGKFVVPGYNDMHAHPLNSPEPQRSLPLMVSYGITGYRQMAGDDALLAARKAGTSPAADLAPELLQTTGPVLAGPAFAAPAAAAAEVRRQAAAGADFIKLVDLPPPAFKAAADAASAAGKRFSGHIPPTVDVRDAVTLGMQSVEHLGGGSTIVEACSRDYPAILAAFRQLPPPKLDFAMPPAMLRKLISNPALLTAPPAAKLMRRALDTYDDATCQATGRLLAKGGVWQVPTLIRIKTMAYGDATEFSANPDLRYASAADRALWQEVGGLFAQRVSPETKAVFADSYARQLKMVKLFDGLGVPMLAGTDFGGQWIVAGASLHQEFALLAEAGLSPKRILQMTTSDAARFLGREATMGSVAAGKDANLVILDADPLAGVANLSRIAGVVRGGRYLPRAELDALRARLAQ